MKERDLKAKTLSALHPCITSDMEFFLEEVVPEIVEKTRGFRVGDLNERLEIRDGNLAKSLQRTIDFLKEKYEVEDKDFKIEQRENGNYDIKVERKGKDIYLGNMGCRF